MMNMCISCQKIGSKLRRQMNKKLSKGEKIKVSFLFLFFPTLLLFVFGLFPIMNLIFLSFTSWNGIGLHFQWVGLANYQKIITDPIYWQVFRVNTYYLVSGIVQMIVAYYFAVILSEKTVAKSFFKSLFIFPTLISGVAIAMIFRLFFSPNGAFDQLLTFLHLENWIHFWLGDPSKVNITLASISLWRNLGISFLLYYGAIQSIPKQYEDVAIMEGANLWQKTRWITIPLTMRVIRLNTLLLIIGVASVFEIPFIMTNGSNGSTTVVIKVMKLAFDQKKYGLASSLSVLITLVIILVSGFKKGLEQRRSRS